MHITVLHLTSPDAPLGGCKGSTLDPHFANTTARRARSVLQNLVLQLLRHQTGWTCGPYTR